MPAIVDEVELLEQWMELWSWNLGDDLGDDLGHDLGHGLTAGIESVKVVEIAKRSDLREVVAGAAQGNKYEGRGDR